MHCITPNTQNNALFRNVILPPLLNLNLNKLNQFLIKKKKCNVQCHIETFLIIIIFVEIMEKSK